VSDQRFGVSSDPLATERFGSGARVALVHGFTQTGRSWRTIVDELSARYEVVTVDLPGHGRSAAIDAADLDVAGRRLVESVGEATYVGYSMGGRILLHAALQAPESVRSMVLVGVSPGIQDERERADRRRADEALADRLLGVGGAPLLISEFLDEWLSQPLFADLPSASQGREAREENSAAGLAAALRHLGTGTQRYAAGQLSHLSMPILLVAGDRDAKYRALGDQLARVIGKNATTAVVASSGHAAPFENPRAFVSLLDAWMRAHGR
jgi:2-succinyl-6-hydroxy-2,4-cyclohexadiene-1-carboxylate synthase